MNAFDHFPAHLHWNAQQLADAVPLRLHELLVADVIAGAPAPQAANRTTTAMRRASGYLAATSLPIHFRIR